jgi:dTDP-4-dehydrorhamnose reductase
MKILILGGTGMLGHKLYQVFSERFDTYVSFKDIENPWVNTHMFAKMNNTHVLYGVDATLFGSVAQAVEHVMPDVVVNCIGIVKQRDESKAAIPSILVNALFPHQLADLCALKNIRLIHLSTDCVFSGARGMYSEVDLPDPVDIYARTKLLGEIDMHGCLTIRTSIIGWELRNFISLLEWFAAQRGRTIKGYRRAIYTGLSTSTLSDLIGDLIESKPDISGLYHIASSPITKYDLLIRVREALNWKDITILADDQFNCDRSLTATQFETTIRWVAPPWDKMIKDLAAEWPEYEAWRK